MSNTEICPLGRLYLFSNRRLIPENAVITNMGTINASQGGVISCYSPPGRGTPVWSGPPGVNLTTIPHLEGEGTVSLVINQDNFTNGQYCCRGGGDTRCVNLYTTSGRGRHCVYVCVCVCVCVWMCSDSVRT